MYRRLWAVLLVGAALDEASFDRTYEYCPPPSAECLALRFRFFCPHSNACEITPVSYRQLQRRLDEDHDDPTMTTIYRELVESLRLFESTWKPSSLPVIGPMINSLIQLSNLNDIAKEAAPPPPAAMIDPFVIEQPTSRPDLILEGHSVHDSSRQPTGFESPTQTWDYWAPPSPVQQPAFGPPYYYHKLFDTVAKVALTDAIVSGFGWTAPVDMSTMPVNSAAGTVAISAVPVLHPNILINGGLRKHPDEHEQAKSGMMDTQLGGHHHQQDLGGYQDLGGHHHQPSYRSTLSWRTEPAEWGRGLESSPDSVFDLISPNAPAGHLVNEMARLTEAVGQGLGLDEDILPQVNSALPPMPLNVRNTFSTLELMNAVENKAIEFFLTMARPLVKAGSVGLAPSAEIEEMANQLDGTPLWDKLAKLANQQPAEDPEQVFRRLQENADLGSVLQSFLAPSTLYSLDTSGKEAHTSSETLPWIPLDSVAGTLPAWFAEALIGPYALLFEDLIKVAQEAYVRMQLVVDAFTDEPLPVSSNSLQTFTNQMSEAFRANLANDEANAIRSVALTVKRLPTFGGNNVVEAVSEENSTNTVQSLMGGYDSFIQSLRKLSAEEPKVFEGMQSKYDSDNLPWLPLDSVVASYGGFLADKTGATGDFARKIARVWAKGSEKLDQYMSPLVQPFLGGQPNSSPSSTIPDRDDNVIRTAPHRQQRWVQSAGNPMTDAEFEQFFTTGGWMPKPSSLDLPIQDLMPAGGQFMEELTQDIADLPTWLSGMVHTAVTQPRQLQAEDIEKLNHFGIPLGTLLEYLGVPVREFEEPIQLEGSAFQPEEPKHQGPKFLKFVAEEKEPEPFPADREIPWPEDMTPDQLKAVKDMLQNGEPGGMAVADDPNLPEAMNRLNKLVHKVKAKKALKDYGMPVYNNPALYQPVPGWTQEASTENLQKYFTDLRNYLKNPIGTVQQTARDNYRITLEPALVTKDGVTTLVMSATERPAKNVTNIYSVADLLGNDAPPMPTNAPLFAPSIAGQADANPWLKLQQMLKAAQQPTMQQQQPPMMQQPMMQQQPPMMQAPTIMQQQPPQQPTVMMAQQQQPPRMLPPQMQQPPAMMQQPSSMMQQQSPMMQQPPTMMQQPSPMMMPGQASFNPLEMFQNLQRQMQNQLEAQLNNPVVGQLFRQGNLRNLAGESQPVYAMTNTYQDDLVFENPGQYLSSGQPSQFSAQPSSQLPLTDMQTYYNNLASRSEGAVQQEEENIVALPLPRPLTLDEIAADPDSINRAVTDYLNDWQHYVRVVQGELPGKPQPLENVVEEVVRSLQESLEKLTANEIFEDSSFGLEALFGPPPSPDPIFIPTVEIPTVAPIVGGSLKKIMFEMMDSVNQVANRNNRETSRLFKQAAENIGLNGRASNDRPNLLLLPLVSMPWQPKKYTGPSSLDNDPDQEDLGAKLRTRPPPNFNVPMGSIIPETLIEEAGRRLKGDEGGRRLTADQGGRRLTADQEGRRLAADQGGRRLTADQEGRRDERHGQPKTDEGGRHQLPNDRKLLAISGRVNAYGDYDWDPEWSLDYGRDEEEATKPLKELQSVFDMLVSALQTGYDTLKTQVIESTTHPEPLPTISPTSKEPESAVSDKMKTAAKQGASNFIQKMADGIVSRGPKIKEPVEQEAFTEDLSALEKTQPSNNNRRTVIRSGSILPNDNALYEYIADTEDEDHLHIPQRDDTRQRRQQAHSAPSFDAPYPIMPYNADNDWNRGRQQPPRNRYSGDEERYQVGATRYPMNNDQLGSRFGGQYQNSQPSGGRYSGGVQTSRYPVEAPYSGRGQIQTGEPQYSGGQFSNEYSGESRLPTGGSRLQPGGGRLPSGESQLPSGGRLQSRYGSYSGGDPYGDEYQSGGGRYVDDDSMGGSPRSWANSYDFKFHNAN